MQRFIVLKPRFRERANLRSRLREFWYFPPIRGRPGGYYNLVSASFGFQLGVQERSVIIMFMTNEAFAGFEAGAGWKVGVDGSVAIVTLGAGGSIDTDKITDPVIGFILDPKGLMLNLTLEGSKISRISP